MKKILRNISIWTKSKKALCSIIQNIEAVAQTCSVKKVFLEILQNSQENTGARY